MSYIRGNLRIPKKLAWLFKPFVIGNYWSETLINGASRCIERGDFKDARIYLNECVELYGESTETVRLFTRISRIELLGE